MTPRVVAVVVHRDRPAHLARCLDSLRALEIGCARTVVVDDASRHSVAACADWWPRTEVVELRERSGPAAARNAGIREAFRDPAFELFLFLDDDAFVQPDTLRALLAGAASERDVGIVVPKAYQDRGRRLLHLAGELEVDFRRGRITPVGAGEIDWGQHDRRRRIGACSGFAMLVRRSLVERIGGFDESFFPPAWEDVDFALRARRAGFAILYEPKAVVEHAGGILGRGPIAERESAKIQNGFALLRRHATRAEKLVFAARSPLLAAALVWHRVRAGDGERIRWWIRGGLRRHPREEAGR